jgi:hypothetical protein
LETLVPLWACFFFDEERKRRREGKKKRRTRKLPFDPRGQVNLSTKG